MDLIDRMVSAYNRASGCCKLPCGDDCHPGPCEQITEDEREGMRAAIAELRETHAVVPREATKAMIERGQRSVEGHALPEDIEAVWLAMVAAGEREPTAPPGTPSAAQVAHE